MMRQVAAGTLILGMVFAGTPIAAQEEGPQSVRLTFDGHPLSRFLYGPSSEDALTTNGGRSLGARVGSRELASSETQVGQPNVSRRTKIWLAVGIAAGVALAATIALGCYDDDGCGG